MERTEVLVSGAGTPQINGVYTFKMMHNGRGAWRRAEEGFLLFWGAGCKVWFISTLDKAGNLMSYYYCDKDQDKPPETGWKIDIGDPGEEPPPMIERRPAPPRRPRLKKAQTTPNGMRRKSQEDHDPDIRVGTRVWTESMVWQYLKAQHDKGVLATEEDYKKALAKIPVVRGFTPKFFADMASKFGFMVITDNIGNKSYLPMDRAIPDSFNTPNPQTPPDPKPTEVPVPPSYQDEDKRRRRSSEDDITPLTAPQPKPLKIPNREDSNTNPGLKFAASLLTGNYEKEDVQLDHFSGLRRQVHLLELTSTHDRSGILLMLKLETLEIPLPDSGSTGWGWRRPEDCIAAQPSSYDIVLTGAGEGEVNGRYEFWLPWEDEPKQDAKKKSKTKPQWKQIDGAAEIFSVDGNNRWCIFANRKAYYNCVRDTPVPPTDGWQIQGASTPPVPKLSYKRRPFDEY